MRYLLTLFLVVFVGQSAFAFNEFGIAYSELGYGSVKNNGLASVNMGTSSGLDGGVYNPANYSVNRNEIAADITLITGISRQSGVQSPIPKVFMGRIGYLINKSRNTYVINYYPRTRLDAGASYRNFDSVAELSFNNLDVAWAHQLNEKTCVGFAFTYVVGNYWNGFDYGSNTGLEDRVYKYKTHGYAFKAGINHDKNGLKYGISLESGISGKSKIVGYYDLNYDFNTPWTLRFGMGAKVKKSEINFQADFFIFERKHEFIIEPDDLDTIISSNDDTDLDMKFALGFSWQYLLHKQWSLLSGIKYAHMTDELDHILNMGLGVEYRYTDNVAFFGSLGLANSMGERFVSLDDSWPISLMTGFMFYEGK